MLNAMVHEHNLLREYLISVKVMSRDEDTKAKQRDKEAERELESFKVCMFFLSVCIVLTQHIMAIPNLYIKSIGKLF